jgi:hypothetical protein
VRSLSNSSIKFSTSNFFAAPKPARCHGGPDRVHILAPLPRPSRDVCADPPDPGRQRRHDAGLVGGGPKQNGYAPGAKLERAGVLKAAMVVLGRRPIWPTEEIDRIRLSDADLRSTTLRKARLDCVALRRAHLEGVHWERTSRVGCQRKARMMKTDL